MCGTVRDGRDIPRTHTMKTSSRARRNLGILTMLGLPATVGIFDAAHAQPAVQNAVLEGIQISSEEGEKPDEKLITCYFIFRDKPTSYFYDINRKAKTLVFEFNDTEMGSSPIPSQSEPPISGFEIEKKRVDKNAEIRGLKPEWHDLIEVTFSLDNIPVITVNDQYNIITFTYKWATNPEKIEEYAMEEKKNIFVPVSLATVGGAGAAALAYYFLRDDGEEKVQRPIPIDDRPRRERYTEGDE